MRIHHTFNIHDVFVASNRFAHLKGRKLSLQEISRQPLILLERDSNTRKFIESFFLERGVPISPEIELASYELLQDFAKIDLGISCVVREFSSESLKNGDLFEVEINPPLPERCIAMVSLKNVSMTSAASNLLEIITSKSL